MIDLHSHLLPGLCDGSQSLETSLEMARIAVSDGTTHLACTPHIYPGSYNNSTQTIEPALESLQRALDEHKIPLQLIIGADTHLVPEVMQGLKTGTIPTLNNGRYFLLEPSHHVPVVNFVEQVSNFLNAGYIPLITHPERLSWVNSHYDDFIEVAKLGAWIQITADAVVGLFGKKAQAASERFLLDGFVHVMASDAHGTARRPPGLSRGVKAATDLLGDSSEVLKMVYERPQAVIDDLDPQNVSAVRGLLAPSYPNSGLPRTNKKSWFSKLFK